MTFGLVYAFSERFILPISHDEVVHGKHSLLGRMPGDEWQRFANLRAYLGFMWTHPGKKLLFMGCEFGQEREWSHDWGLDWFVLDRPLHTGVQKLVRDLNRVYRETPALWELDFDPTGFRWLEANDTANNVLAFARVGDGDAPPLVCVLNLSPMPRYDYRVGMPVCCRWTEALNTDSTLYSGSGVGNMGSVEAEAVRHFE